MSDFNKDLKNGETSETDRSDLNSPIKKASPAKITGEPTEPKQETPAFPALNTETDKNSEDSSAKISFPSLNPTADTVKKEEPDFPELNSEKPEEEGLANTTTILSFNANQEKTVVSKPAEEAPVEKPVERPVPKHAPGSVKKKKPVETAQVKKPFSPDHLSKPTEETKTRIYAPVGETPEETLAKDKERKKQNKKKRRFQIWTAVLVVIVVIEIAICATGLTIFNSMIASSPTLDIQDFVSEESSRVYDDAGDLIAEVGTYYRENITYDKCPESLVDAFLSIEDSRFFTHFGFDIPRFTKAMIENVRAGNFAQGGSTFTMQLVKNTYFSVDAGDESTERKKSIEYKVQQIWLAIKLEQLLDKKEIFQLFMNKLNFGGRIRGVQKAALYYYGKDVSELNLSESAMLAGIINLPNGYNPYVYLDAATTRRDEVLNLMSYHGYITKDECALAKTIRVEDQLVGEDYNKPETDENVAAGSNLYQSYIDAVLDEAAAMTGVDPTIKGMEIYTYMNKTIQDAIEDIQNGETITYPNDLIQTCMISMDNTNGAIVGIGGGRNYNTGARMLNRATSQFKQPGSSVKPVLSYALAFEYLGYSADEILIDKPITYPYESMVLVNATGTYAGDVTIKDAVAYSLNIPAILTLEKVENKIGKEKIVNYMNSVGFTVPTVENFHLSFAIGGTWFETTAEELAGAHSMLINNGVYNQPHTIQKVVMTDGTEYYPENQNKQILSSGSTYLTCELMYNNVYGNVYNYMQILKRDYPVYAKTGTSDWGKDGIPYGIPQGAMKDKWMVASTSKYTNAVWFGYDMAIAGEGTYVPTWLAQQNYPGQINKLLLDAEEEITDIELLQGVQKPADVQSVSYVNGTYPHVTDAATDAYITSEVSSTGLKNQPSVTTAEYLKYIASEENSSSFGLSAKYDGSGAISVTWSSGANACVGGQKNLSLHDEKGNDVDAWGACLVDLSWLTGYSNAGSYWGTVYSNDVYVGDISSETGYYYGYVGDLYGTVKVCGGLGDASACTIAGYADYVSDISNGAGDSSGSGGATGHFDENGNWVDDGWWDEGGNFHHN